MHHLPESRDTANPLLESAQKGREEIIASLMSMNARYEKLLNEVQIVMEQLVETLKKQGKEHKEVSLFDLVIINWEVCDKWSPCRRILKYLPCRCIFSSVTLNLYLCDCHSSLLYTSPLRDSYPKPCVTFI